MSESQNVRTNFKQLHVHDPLIAHLPQSAAIFAILGQTSDEYEWLMNNFVNIRVNKYMEYDDFFREDMWFNCYYIQDNAIARDFINSAITNDYVQLFIKAIDAGYYIFPYPNTKYIAAYNRKYNFRHSPLVYGYDKGKKIFYMSDFFENGMYTFRTATFDEMKEALIYNELEHEWYPHKLFRFFKKKNDYVHVFNLKDLITRLEDYYNSTDFYNHAYYQFMSNDMEEKIHFGLYDAYKTTFGLKTYDVVLELIENDGLWKKLLHLIHCHKIVMEKRLDFIESKFNINKIADLKAECGKMVDLSLKIRNFYLKNSLQNKTGDVVYKTKMTEYCKEIKEIDTCFTMNLIETLKNVVM